MKIKTESAPEKVVKHILADINSGRLNPGDRLPNHQELANQFGVGRSSIREAINALVVMDKLTAKQGKGTFVKASVQTPVASASINADMFESANIYNLMEIREVLECHAVRKAASVISEDQIIALNEAFKRLEKTYKAVHNYLQEDINFHLEIAHAAKNPELGIILKTIHLKVNQRTSVILKTSSSGNVRKAINTARDIIKFIIAGDGFRAERVMREHLGIAKEEFLLALFDESESKIMTLPGPATEQPQGS
jgi:GntR family transcriptional repressor for pyruvate dehydrogenase complex